MTDVEVPSRIGAVVPALLAGAGVLAAQAVLALLPELVTTVQVDQDAARYWGTVALSAALAIVPFAIGVFLSFWFVLPIRSGQSIGAVLGRGAVAALVGGVLVLLAGLLVHEVVAPTAPIDIAALLIQGFDRAIEGLPLVLLVAMLLHAWLRRAEV